MCGPRVSTLHGGHRGVNCWNKHSMQWTGRLTQRHKAAEPARKWRERALSPGPQEQSPKHQGGERTSEPGPWNRWRSWSYWGNIGRSKAASLIKFIFANPIPSDCSNLLPQHLSDKRNGQSDVLHKPKEWFHLPLRIFKDLGLHFTSRILELIRPISWITALSKHE